MIAVLPNNITAQSKNMAKKKKIPCINLRLQKFSWLFSCLLCDIHLQIASASLSFPPPPGLGANSSQDCRPCSFCSDEQRCSTVLWAIAPKIRTGGSFFLGAIYFWGNFKTISQINFKQILVTDFCSNDLKFPWHVYYISKSRHQKFQSKLSSIFFTSRDFLLTVGSF